MWPAGCRLPTPALRESDAGLSGFIDNYFLRLLFTLKLENGFAAEEYLHFLKMKIKIALCFGENHNSVSFFFTSYGIFKKHPLYSIVRCCIMGSL